MAKEKPLFCEGGWLGAGMCKYYQIRVGGNTSHECTKRGMFDKIGIKYDHKTCPDYESNPYNP